MSKYENSREAGEEVRSKEKHSVITNSSALIRTGSWNIPPTLSDDDKNVLDNNLYVSPRFKVLGSYIPALAIRRFGVEYATQLFEEFEKQPELPFGISGLVPRTRKEDNTVHLALTPDNPTKRLIEEELSLMRDVLALDLKLPALYPVIASFNADQHRALIATANSFSAAMAEQTPYNPILTFSSPAIKY